MLITQLLAQPEGQYGSLFFLLARRYKSIAHTSGTATFLNMLAPNQQAFSDGQAKYWGTMHDDKMDARRHI